MRYPLGTVSLKAFLVFNITWENSHWWISQVEKGKELESHIYFYNTKDTIRSILPNKPNALFTDKPTNARISLSVSFVQQLSPSPRYVQNEYSQPITNKVDTSPPCVAKPSLSCPIQWYFGISLSLPVPDPSHKLRSDKMSLPTCPSLRPHHTLLIWWITQRRVLCLSTSDPAR